MAGATINMWRRDEEHVINGGHWLQLTCLATGTLHQGPGRLWFGVDGAGIGEIVWAAR